MYACWEWLPVVGQGIMKKDVQLMQEILTSEWLLEFQCLLGWCCALAHLPHSVSYVIEGFHCIRTISQSICP